jgi:hypothetical protein
MERHELDVPALQQAAASPPPFAIDPRGLLAGLPHQQTLKLQLGKDTPLPYKAQVCGYPDDSLSGRRFRHGHIQHTSSG